MNIYLPSIQNQGGKYYISISKNLNIKSLYHLIGFRFLVNHSLIKHSCFLCHSVPKKQTVNINQYSVPQMNLSLITNHFSYATISNACAFLYCSDLVLD